MRSAFGVEHTIAKAGMPDWAVSALPGSTVAAYNKSTRHRKEAAARNLGAKVVGGAVGSAVGLGAMAAAGRKVPGLQRTTVLIARKGKHAKPRVAISPEKKAGWAEATVVGATGGVGSTYAGNRSLKRVKRDSRYGYRSGSVS